MGELGEGCGDGVIVGDLVKGERRGGRCEEKYLRVVGVEVPREEGVEVRVDVAEVEGAGRGGGVAGVEVGGAWQPEKVRRDARAARRLGGRAAFMVVERVLLVCLVSGWEVLVFRGSSEEDLHAFK